MEPSETLTVEDYVRKHVHRPFLESVMRGLLRCYQTANEIVDDKIPGRAGLEARPHIQRGLVDNMLLFEARKFPKHVSAKMAENSVGNSVHAEVYCGALTLTAHFIQTPKSPVRPGKYREGLSEHPDQCNLFGAPTVLVDDRLYGQIVHGCTGRDKQGKERSQPDFVMARFPLPGCFAYSTAEVDLIREFPHIFGRRHSNEFVPPVQDDAEPMLKPQEGTGDVG